MIKDSIKIIISIGVFSGLFLPNTAAQTKLVDSLRKALAQVQTDDNKLAIVFQLCEQRRSLNADSLYRYASIGKRTAIALRNEDDVNLASYYLACALEQKNFLDSGANILSRLIKQAEKKNTNTDLYRKCLALKSNFLIRDNNYKGAIAQCYQLLANGEANKDTFAQITAYCGIGWAYMELNQSALALQWFRKALSFMPAFQSPYYSVIYSNMAAVHGALEQFDSAEYNINIAASLARKHETLSFLANTLNIKADIFILTNRDKQAEPLLKEALAIRQKLGDPYYIVSDMSQFALYYAHNGQATKSISLVKQGLHLARTMNITSKLPLLYHSLAECYKAAGNMEDYGKALEQMIALKDSIYLANSAEALASLNAKYELQKKENTIMRQKFEMARQDYLLLGSILVLLFIICCSIILFNNYRKREKLKLQWLLEQEKANALHDVKEAEEKERKRIAADLHDNLGAYAASIASNIDNINQNLLGDGADFAMRALRTNALSMVSELSDTIWVLKKDALSLTAISDRLKAFLLRLQPSYPNIRMDVQENIVQDHLLQPSQAFHLFHILQEAVNNALRHSDATQVTININDDPESWQVIINDNGDGMPKQEIVSGNGIANMRNRAMANGWEVIWTAAIPKGTIIKILATTTTN